MSAKISTGHSLKHSLGTLSCDMGAAKWPGLTGKCTLWASMTFCQKQRQSTAGQASVWKQATGHHSEEWLPQKWVSQAPHCLFFSLLPSSHFTIFQGLPQKEERRKTLLQAPIIHTERDGWVNQAEAVDSCSVYYCVTTYLQNLWLKTTICYCFSESCGMTTLLGSFPLESEIGWGCNHSRIIRTDYWDGHSTRVVFDAGCLLEVQLRRSIRMCPLQVVWVSYHKTIGF